MDTYEKKYKEALERASNLHKDAVEMENNMTTKTCEIIFPELKAGKEGEIRKIVYGWINNQPSSFFDLNGLSKEDMLAWLEKQSYTKKDIDDAYLKGVTNTKNEIEKQYEANYQIRKDIATFIFNYRGDIKDRAKWMDYLGIKVSFVEKQGEQNHCMIQWKGDNLKEVIDFTGKDKNFEKWFKSFEEYEKYVQEHDGIFKLFNADGSHYEVPVGAWIVKTPDGYNVASKAIFRQKSVDTPKFKVEQTSTWSEEDEREVAVLEAYIRSKDWSESHIDRALGIVDELVNKVKSFRNQNTWRPSDVQMELLKEACDQHWEPDGLDPLYTLYPDLKKLKG